jgi:hypothetical protein
MMNEMIPAQTDYYDHELEDAKNTAKKGLIFRKMKEE